MTYLIVLGREARAEAVEVLEGAGWCAMHLALQYSTAVKSQLYYTRKTCALFRYWWRPEYRVMFVQFSGLDQFPSCSIL